MSGPDARYTDPATGVLRNRLGIQDAGALERAETAIVTVNATRLLRRPLAGAYDLDHLRAVHRFLFADVYDWAGEVRQVQTAKGRTMFPPPQLIEAAADDLFGQLKRERELRDLPPEQLLDRLAHYMGETHALHPFREGNSRSGRAFYGQLARERGLRIAWQDVPRDRVEAAKDHAVHVDATQLRSILADYSEPVPNKEPGLELLSEPPLNADIDI